jgi:flagellar hook-associated protein 1 FlgK
MDGHVVVQEENYRSISYYEDSSGNPQLSLAANAGGITITSLLGGKFGARTEAYAQVDSLLSDFNDWVTTFTNDFNAVHQTGFDQNGSTGLDFFSVSTISPATSFSVDANLLLDSSLIAAGGALNPLTGFPDAGDKDVLDLLIGLETSTGYGATGVNTAREQLTNMFTNIATQVRSAEDNYDMQTMRMEDIMELRNSVSGVNLDEEAVKLMEYQASYSAASRVISVTNSLLGSLMEIV